MKKRILSLMLLILGALISCKKDKLNELTGPLGGDTNIPLTQVGNVTHVYISGSSQPAVMVVATNDDGTVNYAIAYSLAGRADSAALVALIPPKFLDEQNRVLLNLHLRITSEGYQDADKPFIIVKYDSNVGDVYSYTLPSGQKLVRTVTQKSTTDDYYWGMYMIKTITVEQTTFAPDLAALVSKYTFKANHRFGMVYFEAVLKNGSVLKMDLYPQFSL